MSGFRVIVATMGLVIFVAAPWCSADNTVRYGIRQDFLTQYAHPTGIFWSHAISDKIFTEAGYHGKIIRRPSRRMPLSLVRDEVDIIYGIESVQIKYRAQFLRAKLPATVTSVYIYFSHRSGWDPVWPPDLAFKNKVGKSVHSTDLLKSEYQLKLSQGASFDAAVKMVNLGRVDYYVEHEGGMIGVSPGLIKSQKEGFSQMLLFRRAVYAYFQNTNKGASLLRLYNKGQLEMYQNSKYGEVFFHATPIEVGSHPIDNAVIFINQKHPELKIPTQPIE